MFLFALPCRTAVAQSCPAPCGTTCGTIVPGGTVVNTTWTKAGSPYCVAGNLQVSLLTIEPGVCVLVDGAYVIEVLSTIDASGTEDEPITFTAKNTAARWLGMRFQSTPPGSILRHCNFSYSSFAAIRIVDSSPTIEHCRIENNLSTGPGGGLTASITSGDLQLEDCEILTNGAGGNGGGINATMSSGTLRLHRCIVDGNVVGLSAGTSGGGGGVYVTGASEFENCSFSSNVVNAVQTIPGACAAVGGGLYSNSGASSIANCIFSANTVSAEAIQGSAFGRGGSIYLGNGSAHLVNTIVGCGVAQGDSGSQGGGIYVAGGSLTLENSTIARANVQGIFNAAGSVDAANTIVYFNNAGGVQISGAATASYCDVQGGYPGTGNIQFNPAFGGTGCEISDLTVILGSPCIDAGDPSGAFNDVCFPPSLGGVRNDIGAHGGAAACDWVNQNALEGAVRYCNATRNSSGLPAEMGSCGSSSITANDLTLVATHCPLNKNGFFFYGYVEDHTMFGNGWRCVGSPIARLKPVINTGPTGTATRLIDYGNLPPNVPITAGSVRRFQFWFRDPPGGGAQTNLTDGLKVYFGP
jgi:hypothetical protein